MRTKRPLALVFALALLAAAAAPAAATVHPLVCSELSSAPAGSVAQTQDPPGLTTGEAAPVANPVVTVLGNPTASDLSAFKPEGC